MVETLAPLILNGVWLYHRTRCVCHVALVLFVAHALKPPAWFPTLYIAFLSTTHSREDVLAISSKIMYDNNVWFSRDIFLFWGRRD